MHFLGWDAVSIVGKKGKRKLKWPDVHFSQDKESQDHLPSS